MPNHSILRRPAINRPSLALLGAEPWRAAYEYVHHKLTRHRVATPGDGHPVILFPGLGADATSMQPLRKHCEALGYNAMDWGQGFNTGPHGDIDTWMATLANNIEHMLAPYDQRATLIGWSLGGLYARELGKLLRPQVRQVITIGTPFNASADHTHAGWLYRLLGGRQPAPDADLSERLRVAPPVPTTSIYSRSDGVVAWQTCRHDTPADKVQDLEVRGSHLGLGWNPAVLRIIGDRLAQRPGKWRPYGREFAEVFAA